MLFLAAGLAVMTWFLRTAIDVFCTEWDPFKYAAKRIRRLARIKDLDEENSIAAKYAARRHAPQPSEAV